MIIALSGIDGAGKTTVATQLKELLQGSGIPTTYRHEYSYPVASRFLHLLGDKRIAKQRSRFLSMQGRQSYWAKLWPFLVFLDAIAVQVYYQILRRRRLLILDRFAYDQLISFEELGVSNRLVRCIYMNFPRPSTSILVCVNPETAFIRRQKTHEFTVEDYRRGQLAYLRIAGPLGMKIVFNDNTSSIWETLQKIVEVLLKNGDLRKTFLRKALNNRLLYKFICNSAVPSYAFPKARTHYEKMRQRLVRSLQFVENELTPAGIDWILLKSYMDFEYIPTYDLDILVRPSDTRKVIEKLTTDTSKVDSAELGKVNIRTQDLFTFSIHQAATWDGFAYVSSRLLWDHPRTVEWYGFQTKIPRIEADLLTHISHILFEVASIRLCDLYYLRSLLSRPINWDLITSEVRAEGWAEGFSSLLSIIRSLLGKLEAGHPIGFPHPVPYHVLLMSLYRKVSFETSRKSGLRWTPLLRDTTRFFLWRLYHEVFDKAPFGDTLLVSNS